MNSLRYGQSRTGEVVGDLGNVIDRVDGEGGDVGAAEVEGRLHDTISVLRVGGV